MSELRTFRLPEQVDGTSLNQTLARQLIDAWREDGIFQVALDPAQCQTTAAAFQASREFFRRPLAQKAACISDLTYSGLHRLGRRGHRRRGRLLGDLHRLQGRAADGSAGTRPVALPRAGPLARSRLSRPHEGLHGPARRHRGEAAAAGGAGPGAARPGHAHAPGSRRLAPHAGAALSRRRPRPDRARGIGAHTDYGMLVIAAQDDVGGLCDPSPGRRRDPQPQLAARRELGRHVREPGALDLRDARARAC